jgi:hypothetical protein
VINDGTLVWTGDAVTTPPVGHHANGVIYSGTLVTSVIVLGHPERGLTRWDDLELTLFAGSSLKTRSVTYWQKYKPNVTNYTP